MANDYRGRDRWRDDSRDLFGYEGEGYMRGAGRDIERDFGPSRPPRRFRPNDYGDFNRGDYVSGDDRPQEQPQSFRGRGPKNYQRSDERIHEDVCERLSLDERVDASDIEVTVQGGIVTLSGTVTDRMQKRRAEDLAENVGGVKDVDNRVRVGRS